MTSTLSAAIQFLHKALWLMIMYYQTKFGSKRISIWEEIEETVLLWPYEPLLRPWPCRKQTNLFAWHSGSLWCILIPSLVTKHWQSMRCHLDKHSLIPYCDLDFECSNPFFPQDTGVWGCIIRPSLVAKNQQFRRYSRKVIFWWSEPSLWPSSRSKQYFCTWHSDAASPYQIW